MMKLNQRPRVTFILLAAAICCLLYISTLNTNSNGVECAPTTLTNSNGKTTSTKTSSSTASATKNTGNRRPGILSNLFRRQTPAVSSSSSSSSEDETTEAQTQTEIDAQKFMESLPQVGGSSNQGPSSFRERVSDTFGLLREGVNNQFRSLRDNFSETVEDLRETWSSGQE